MYLFIYCFLFFILYIYIYVCFIFSIYIFIYLVNVLNTNHLLKSQHIFKYCFPLLHA